MLNGDDSSFLDDPSFLKPPNSRQLVSFTDEDHIGCVCVLPSVLFLLSVVLLASVVENCSILGKNLVIDLGW